MQGGYHDASQGLLSQIHRPKTRGVQIAIHPRERGSRGKLFARRIERMGKGCREDATSRRTIFPPGADAGVAGESRAYRIVLVLVANSHKKSAETSLGAADTSVCATFISSEGSKNVETPAAGFQPALPLTYKAHPAGWKAGCSQA